MKLLINLWIVCAVFLAVQVLAKPLDFGVPVDMALIEPVSSIMATPDEYLEKMVAVEGTIVAVCAKRGCWLDMASDKQFEKLRIKVKDGDMVFPLNAKGRKALAMGKLKKIALSLEKTISYRKHQAEEDGSDFDPASVTEPLVFYQLVPVGVRILD